MVLDVFKECGAYLLKIVLMALIAWIAASAKKAFYKRFDTKEKREIARTVVYSVEQMFKKLHGEDKLKEAMKLAEKLSIAAGLPFDPVEMRALIEYAVAEANHVFDEEEEAEPPTSPEVEE